jgi:thioesterase domain-containing protein
VLSQLRRLYFAVSEGPHEMIRRESLRLPVSYAAPATKLEVSIAGAFAEVFELDQVGADDSFFDLGGDSLLGEVLSELISQRAGRDFQISSLMEHSSPRQIAGLLSGEPTDPNVSPPKRPPIFIVHGRKGFILLKPEFRQAFAEGQEVQVFELPGLRGGPSCDRVEDIAAAYVAQITELNPRGPILIAAFCVGALIALEMASQLSGMRRPISQLVLLDPGLPKNRPLNLKREIKNKARVAGSPAHEASNWRLRAQLLLHRLRGAVRFAKVEKVDFFEDLSRFRTRLLAKELRGRSKFPEQAQSVEACAKLHAALRQYRPAVFDGPVTILASLERDMNYPWSVLLPRRRVNQVFKKHDEVGTAHAARLVQSICDAALAELQPRGTPERKPMVVGSTTAASVGREGLATRDK